MTDAAQTLADTLYEMKFELKLQLAGKQKVEEGEILFVVAPKE